jgi:hypothetical protein
MLNIDTAKKINFEMSFKQFLHSYETFKTKAEQKNFLKSLLRRLLRSSITMSGTANHKNELIFVKSMDRDDYNRILSDIQSITSEYSTFIIKPLNDGKLNIGFSRFLTANIKKIDFVQHENKNITMMYKILFLYSCYIVEQFLESTTAKKVIFFSDMQCFENFLCQYLKLIGTKTATLQHGLYVEYNDDSNINVINYKHHVSDYFLAWGKCTELLIKKHNSHSKVIIVGKPFLSTKAYKKINETRLLVVLDQNIFAEYNFKMLDIVEAYCNKHGNEWSVRFHPGNNKNTYYQKHPNIKEESENFHYNVVVGHTSSLLYEALVAGYKIAKFETTAESIETPPNYMFSSIDDLEMIVSTEQAEHDASYRKYLIAAHGAESLENYKIFLNKTSW